MASSPDQNGASHMVVSTYSIMNSGGFNYHALRIHLNIQECRFSLLMIVIFKKLKNIYSYAPLVLRIKRNVLI